MSKCTWCTRETQDTCPECKGTGSTPPPEESTLREAEKLSKFFHDTYERLAPEYNYTTKKETRVFDPKSNNGQLMVAVASEVVKLILERERLAREDELNKDIKELL